ncbi:MAG: hypothetical protein ACNYVW_01735 [Methanosarcinales archaeon]
MRRTVQKKSAEDGRYTNTQTLGGEKTRMERNKERSAFKGRYTNTQLKKR